MKRRNFLKITGGGAVAGAAVPMAAEARPNLEVPADAVGMLYDATLCIGCKACMVQCKKVNGMPPETSPEGDNWDAAKDLSGKTLNVIKAYQHGTAEVKDRETNGFSFVKRHCMHCVD
ncbi:MAG: hydrogenase 2 protein HybA, partial [Gammaproteobacteria bacterium]